MITEWRIGVIAVSAALTFAFVYRKHLARILRARGYFRGAKLDKKKQLKKTLEGTEGLQWGSRILPVASASRHFLIAGTTGSGKTHVQRLLLKRPLLRLPYEPDSRMLIYDAKGDATPYLHRIGYEGELYSLNPFEARDSYPQAVGWDAGKDISSPTLAMNLASAIVPEEKGGNNIFFVNASRHIISGILKSLVKHNPGEWTFSDFVSITLDRELARQVLSRDAAGRKVLKNYLREDKTGDDVFSTVCTQVAYFEPVAALWKTTTKQISIREWLTSNSVLMLGSNAAASAALDFLNKQLFKFFADQVDVQENSSTRRTYVWLEEAREAKGIVDTESLQLIANKGRSRGVSLILAFQDIEGFREAAGDKKADNLIGQCSHKALLRFESYSSAEWASKLLGQYEAIEVFRSDNDSVMSPESKSEQRVVRDAVLPSEFFMIPETHPDFGLEGYFLAPSKLPNKTWLSPQVVAPVVVSDEEEIEHGIKYRSESDQWLPELATEEADKLGIELEKDMDLEPVRKPSKKIRFRTGAAWNREELSQVASLEESYLAEQLEP